jgi:hypothetical protein
MDKHKAKELGDFQTPALLTTQICTLLADRGLAPASVLEPTCGIGNFLLAALDQFPTIVNAIGVELNPNYLDRLQSALDARPDQGRVRIVPVSFFDADWTALLRSLPEPILVIGNPPWVTNARLGSSGSTNLPPKTNFQNHRGLDALTGKSNFDISEWMLVKLLDLLATRRSVLAMLCKTAVARKVLAHLWKNDRSPADAEIWLIDAASWFEAAVDACLLIVFLENPAQNRHGRCRVYRRLADTEVAQTIAYHDGRLIADVAAYNRWKHLEGESVYRWRSGVKHDCARVMELRKEGDRYRNGLGESIDLEDTYLYAMLKSSELAHGQVHEPRRWMLLTQRTVGDDTSVIAALAPKT